MFQLIWSSPPQEPQMNVLSEPRENFWVCVDPDLKLFSVEAEQFFVQGSSVLRWRDGMHLKKVTDDHARQIRVRVGSFTCFVWK